LSPINPVTRVSADVKPPVDPHFKPMNPITSSTCPWRQLQIELREHAFVLDLAGNPTAADLAAMIAARIDELLAEKAHLDGVPPGNAD
jgi:hypothetical protein